MGKKEEVICDVHNEITELNQDIICLATEIKDKKLKKQILKKGREIDQLLSKAYSMGNDMESRLSEYFEGISQLGFERVKMK